MNEPDDCFRRNTTVVGFGASTFSTTAYCPLRVEPTPGGGKMILS